MLALLVIYLLMGIGITQNSVANTLAKLQNMNGNMTNSPNRYQFLTNHHCHSDTMKMSVNISLIQMRSISPYRTDLVLDFIPLKQINGHMINAYNKCLQSDAKKRRA